MKATALMCTYGRHQFVERSVRMFLEQDYENKHIVIFQNSPEFQTMHEEYPNITLVNQTGFETMGNVYEEAIKHMPLDTDLVFVWDDDIYFPNHISNGVAGILKYKKLAYKHKFSLMRNKYEISTISNTLEATWALRKELLLEVGFSNCNFTDSHRAWVSYCRENNEVYVDEDSPITFCYSWNNPESLVVHISSIEKLKNSKEIHHTYSTDHGDGVITPCSVESIHQLYSEFVKYI